MAGPLAYSDTHGYSTPVTAANPLPVTGTIDATALVDGADVTQGAIADASVAAGATGTISAKLRRATQGLEDLKTLIVLAAGENHIGEVGTPADVITVTPTVSASPDYSIGDAVGGKQTLTSAARVSGGKVVLQSLTLIDKANQKKALTVLFFDSDPTAATITDNSAFVFSTAISKYIGRVDIAATDYVTVDSIALVSLGAIGKAMKASGSANLFVAVVAVEALNLATTSDLIFGYGFLQG